MDPSSPQQTGGKSVGSCPPHAAASSVDFTDANIQGRSEADCDDNRLSGPRYESNDFQYAIRDNPSPTDLSWTPYGDQATTQGLEDNQQHSILGLSQISQTQTVLSQDFGSTKSPSVTQALAAAKAEEATWQEVLCTRWRTENLKRIVQTGRRIQSPTAQGDDVYFSRHLQVSHSPVTPFLSCRHLSPATIAITSVYLIGGHLIHGRTSHVWACTVYMGVGVSCSVHLISKHTLIGVHLAGVHLTGVHLTHRRISQAYISQACISQAYISLTGVHLTSVHLTSVHLTSVHLTSVHLTGVHLTHRRASHRRARLYLDSLLFLDAEDLFRLLSCR